jgi:pimeloyl-ACP methyl ester carboxylesterase
MTLPLLTHRVTGSETGPPVLLLNGGMMSIAAWEPIAERLAPSFRVVRCDFRGQALTPGVPEPRLDAHLADVVALLDSLEIGRIHAAGTSYGAFIAVLLAARHPDRVASVAAITATERLTAEMWKGTQLLLDAAREGAEGGDGGRVLDLLLPATYTPGYLEAQRETLAFHRHWVASLPPLFFRGLEAILASLESVDLRSELPRISCPALVVAGEDDATFPLEHSQALAIGIGGARLEILPGGPHGLVIEQAARLGGVLLDFLLEIQ